MPVSGDRDNLKIGLLSLVTYTNITLATIILWNTLKTYASNFQSKARQNLPP